MKRYLSLSVILVLSVLAGWQARGLTFDTSIEVWFVEDDPDLVSYRSFIDAFESDQIVVMAWEDPELWTDEGLRFLYDSSIAAEGILHVRHVRSIATLMDVVSEPGMLTTRPYYDPENPPQPMQLREWILSNDLIKGSLVSVDGQVPAMILAVDHLIDEPGAKLVLAQAIRELGETMEAERGVHVAMAGPTMLDDAFFRHTRRDSFTIMPLMALVIIVSMLALFRTWRALLLPLSVVGIACLWVAGFMGLMGYRVTIIHTVIFPLVMGVGIASSIHVLSRTITLRAAGGTPDEAAQGALRYLLAPCFYTAATTVAGLASLMFATLAPLRQFGILASVGVFSAFLLTYGLGPSLLPLMRTPENQAAGLARLWAWWDAQLLKLADMSQSHGKVVLLVSLALLVGSLIGLKDLRIGNNPLEYYKTDDPVRVDLEFVDERLAGTGSVEVLVETGEVDGLKEPEVLRKIEEVEAFLDGLEGIGATISIVEFLKELRQAQRGGADEDRILPATRAEVAQLLLLVDNPEEIERLVDFDYSRARIQGTIKLSYSDALTRNVDALEAKIADVFQPPLSASATGTSKLIANMNDYLLRSAIVSMGAAFVIVLFFMMLALRSVRLGLFAMIPNLLPIGMVLGLMGWVGIRLDPGTTMIAAVALGLVVDDTLHFLHHFRDRIHAGDSIHDATHDTLHHTGRAIAMTSVILCAAFWLLLGASFMPNIFFGLLCGTAIALALVANLVVLTAALALFHPRI